MSVTNYGELRAAVASYTHRADFNDGAVNADRVPEFINLAERRINRTLQKLGGGETVNNALFATVAGVETVDLPADFNAMRYLATTGGSHTREVKYRTPEVMYKEWPSDSQGLPKLFTIHGNNLGSTSDTLQLRLRPIPDAIYNLMAFYYKKVIPLSPNALGDSAQNWMLLFNPDVYIYASCLEAAGWIRDAQMLQDFSAAFLRAVNDITNADDDRRVASASPRAAPSFRMVRGM